MVSVFSRRIEAIQLCPQHPTPAFFSMFQYSLGESRLFNYQCDIGEYTEFEFQYSLGESRLFNLACLTSCSWCFLVSVFSRRIEAIQHNHCSSTKRVLSVSVFSRRIEAIQLHLYFFSSIIFMCCFSILSANRGYSTVEIVEDHGVAKLVSVFSRRIEAIQLGDAMSKTPRNMVSFSILSANRGYSTQSP